MPNHWHLVLWPQEDGLLSRFMNWLTLTHTQRWARMWRQAFFKDVGRPLHHGPGKLSDDLRPGLRGLGR